MGMVFRARHLKLGTQRAVKVLIAGEHASLETLARFQREAAAVSKMGKHPHIVSVFDLGQQGAVTYYVMELVEGKSLANQLRTTKYQPHDAASLVEKVARALHFAHAHKVIHRDVKPDNIMVRPDGEPLITDFGLAREVDSSARISLTGQVMGTPSYMSPEQARGDVQATDARTDVYAAGAVLYELLTGVPPHPGMSVPDVLVRIQRGELIPPRTIRPQVPKDLETICLKAVAFEPARRYQTAEAFAHDLRRFLDGEPISARPASLIVTL